MDFNGYYFSSFKIGDLHRYLQSSKCWEKSSWISYSSPHFLTLFHHLCCANNFNSHQKTSNWNWGQCSSTQAKTYEVRSDRNIPTSQLKRFRERRSVEPVKFLFLPEMGFLVKPASRLKFSLRILLLGVIFHIFMDKEKINFSTLYRRH